jgi:hypothetical protein
MVKKSKKNQTVQKTTKIKEITNTQKMEKPGMIERNFRKELGEINPYLCLVDSAVCCLITKTKSESNKAKFLRKVTENYGHYNLYTEHLNLDYLSKFVHSSHIALINSKAELACKQLREIIWIDKNNELKEEVRDNIKGDFYRRTILEIHCYKEGNSSFAKAKKDADKKVNEEIFADYIGGLELKVLDYFRHIRNYVLHGSNNNTTLLEDFKLIDQHLLHKKYHLHLNQPVNLTFTDVLLLSKVWQESVREMCRKSLKGSDILEYLNHRYQGVTSKNRKKNGIIQTLKQDYLQTDEEISIIVDGWVG